MNVLSPSSSSRVEVIAVHGVGECAEGDVINRIQRALPHLSDVTLNIHELNWSALFRPGYEIGLRPKELARLARALSIVPQFGWSLSQGSSRTSVAIWAMDRWLAQIASASGSLFPVVGVALLVDLLAWAIGAAGLPLGSRTVFVGVLIVCILLHVISICTGLLSGTAASNRGVRASLAVALRRSLVSAFGQLYLTLCLPGAAALGPKGAYGFAVLAIYGSVLLPIAWVLTFLYFRLFHDAEEVVRGLPPLGRTVLTWLATGGIFLLAAGLLVLVARILGTVAKLIGDALIYLGEHSQRAAILDKFDGLVKAIAIEDAHIILYGHSQGSVIVFDYLRSRANRFSRARSVTLITAGSPLARYHHQFFPEEYPEPSAAGSTLQGLLPRFHWLNVYRPFDVIGACLGLAQPWGEDISTKERMSGQILCGRITAPHENYFGSKRVIELLQPRLFERLGAVPVQRQIESTELMDLPELPLVRLGFSGAANIAASLLAWSMVVAWFFWWLPEQAHQAVADRVAHLMKTGIAAEGVCFASKSSTVWIPGTDQPLGKVLYFTSVSFETSDGGKLERKRPLLVDDKLVYEWASRGRQLEYDPDSIRFEHKPVDVRYDPKDPSIFVLPSFVRESPDFSWYRDCVWFVCAALLLWPFVEGARLYTGLSHMSNKDPSSGPVSEAGLNRSRETRFDRQSVT